MRVIWAVSLAVLVILAVFQYRMLEEVSRAQRLRMQEGLEATCRDLVQTFDAEFSGLSIALLAGLSEEEPSRWLTELDARWQSWRRSARFPELVTSLYVVDSVARTAQRSEGNGFAPTTYTDVERISGPRQRGRGERRRSPIGLRPDPLRIVVPLLENHFGPGRGRRMPRTFLIVRIDETYLSGEVLPTLIDDYLIEDYAVAVRADQRERDLIYQRYPESLPESAEIVREPLLQLRLSPEQRRQLEEDASEETRRRMTLWRFLAAPDGPEQQRALWRLSVGHRDGSLETVLRRAHLRNLTIGGGILAILAVSVALMARSAQRSRSLAKRQLELVAGVSHELMTPLTGIHSAAQNLSEGVIVDPERVRRYGQLIQDESGRLTNMVEQVLSYAGIQSGRHQVDLEPIPATNLFEACLNEERAHLEAAGFELVCTIPTDLPAVAADREALGRAIHNLVGNALKYAGDSAWLGVEARVAAGRVTLQICDRGPGIHREDLPHIFEPFYRGKGHVASNIPGSGLGLCLVRHIVHAHGGKISARASGKGTCFIISLPIYEEAIA